MVGLTVRPTEQLKEVIWKAHIVGSAAARVGPLAAEQSLTRFGPQKPHRRVLTEPIQRGNTPRTVAR
jgi:hypothetical protein